MKRHNQSLTQAVKDRLFLVLFFGVFLYNAAIGCTCTNQPIMDYLQQNDSLSLNEKVLVIRGRVLDVGVGDSVFNKFGQGNLINVKVLEYWPKDALKFLNGDIVTVFNDESDCAINFKKDSSYLIRAYSFNRYLATSICEGTKLLSKSLDDIELLGAGSEPNSLNMPDQKLNQENKISASLLILLLALSGLVNLVLIILFIRTRSKRHVHVS